MMEVFSPGSVPAGDAWVLNASYYNSSGGFTLGTAVNYTVPAGRTLVVCGGGLYNAGNFANYFGSCVGLFNGAPFVTINLISGANGNVSNGGGISQMGFRAGQSVYVQCGHPIYNMTMQVGVFGYLI